MSKMRYGLKWLDKTPEYDIHLKMYRFADEYRAKGATPDTPYYHMSQAAQLMYPEPELIWDTWTDERCHIWCEHDFATVLGAAGTTKSNSFGLFALLDWWSAPKQTLTFLCSTSKDMLEIRIWEAVMRYFNKYKKSAPGALSKKRLAIINSDDVDEDGVVKASLRGVAVQQGTVEEAKSNLIGGHLPFVRLIIDEMQSTRPAAIEARSNLSKACKDFKFVGMGNPHSKFDLLCAHSEPLQGWNSVNVESHDWPTKYGHCYHYDGFKSPANEDPDRYHYLINRKQIDKDIHEFGEDSLHVWQMCRGFPPPSGTIRAVISETEIINYKMRDKPKWQSGYKVIAGLDPAFTAGGDKCMLAVCKVGYLVTGEYCIAVDDMIHIKFGMSSKLDPVAEIARQVMQFGDQYGFGPEDLAVDDSGVQSVAERIEEQWGKGVHRVSFGSNPTDFPVSVHNRRSSKEEYKDHVTEIWYTIAMFGRYGQIRGITDAMVTQLCTREVEEGFPKKMVPKRKMKNNRGMSPDDVDAFGCAVSYLRFRMGMNPGATKLTPHGVAQSFSSDLMRDFDIDAGNKYAEDIFA